MVDKMNTEEQISCPMASLYVGDLHENVTESMLYKKFSSVGTVYSLRIYKDIDTEKSLGYALVKFCLFADAKRALETINFDLILGKPMRIMWFKKDSSLRKSGLGNIFVKYLDKDIKSKALYNAFSVFGTVLSCKVVLGEHGSSKGYAFVHFESEADANKAISTTNGMLLNGQNIYVAKFTSHIELKKQISIKTKLFANVYIKNFKRNVNDKFLYNIFKEFGNIINCSVMKNSDGSSKCFGFVCYMSPEEATKAVTEMNGKMIGSKPLHVSLAQQNNNREE